MTMMNNKSTWTTAVFAVMTMLAVTCTVGSAFVVTTPTANKPTGTTSTQVFSELAMGKPGTADIPCAWEDLGFEFRPTKSHVRMTFKDGEWSEPELVTEPYINLHIGATALRYGQACFEGLKAFAHEDDTVHIFRPDENAKRMQSSCQRTMMAAPPTDKFLEACNTAVKDNIEYVPPYGSNGALYVRPLLFGSGPRIGLQPADEYTLLVMVIPVGDYYKGGMSKPVDAVVVNNYDRAAPMGVGGVKVAGNYAADLLPNTESKQQGFPISLYLDAATRSVVEEFSTSNFVGIKRDTNTFVTPASPSVLPSITNKSLMALAAQELGMTVEQRDVPLNELDEFDEILAVGTAVVVTPVGSITVFDEEGVPKRYEYGDEIGETTMKLYSMMRAIQNGEVADKNEWNRQVV